MNKHNDTPQTLQDAIKFFSDPDRAHDLMVQARWPNGIACPHCGTLEEHTYLANYRRWKCKGCKKQFTVKVGTLFEDSPLSLEKWLTALWLVTNAKNGISSCEVARAIGITQKSAWFVLHRVRIAMQLGTVEKMRGPVECDEMYVGGLGKNKHANKKTNNGGRGIVGKEIVMGILERGKERNASKIRAKVVKDTKKPTLHSEVKANVELGAAVYTDNHYGYWGLSPDLEHAWVDHAIRYVDGQIHTNGCENFWSLFSRMLHGTYTHVDPRHLQSYLDEQTARFNLRGGNDGSRFLKVVKSISGKRLTYQELTERGLVNIAE